jgi:transposase
MKIAEAQLAKVRERQQALVRFRSAKAEGYSNRLAARKAGHPFSTLYRWSVKYQRTDLPVEAYMDKPHVNVRSAKKKRLAKLAYTAALESLEAAGARSRQADLELEQARENLSRAEKHWWQMTRKS